MYPKGKRFERRSNLYTDWQHTAEYDELMEKKRIEREESERIAAEK